VSEISVLVIKEKAVITLPDARLTVDRQVITKLGKDQFDHSRVPQLAHLNNPSWHGGSQNGGAAATTFTSLLCDRERHRR
jgi:hypothetical protein